MNGHFVDALGPAVLGGTVTASTASRATAFGLRPALRGGPFLVPALVLAVVLRGEQVRGTTESDPCGGDHGTEDDRVDTDHEGDDTSSLQRPEPQQEPEHHRQRTGEDQQ